VSMRRGITTGTCSAAAAKAAASVLTGADAPREVCVGLPGGASLCVPILFARLHDDRSAATAAVRKDAGDDPDVTHGLEIRATVRWDDTVDVAIAAGEGVGVVTKPGLQVPPGEPAINPVPRRMIAEAVREITPRGVRIEIAIPGGREIAGKTFNPRLGICGGLSILGTSGLVRPYCRQAFRDAMACSYSVAVACGVTCPVLVPGNIGAGAARRHFAPADEQLLEVGNEWGFVMELLARHAPQAVLLVGHPGKLVKLSDGQWDTHSARSERAVDALGRLCREVLGRDAPARPTAEGLFAALEPAERDAVATEAARRIRAAVEARGRRRWPAAVVLADMAGAWLAADGDLSPWK
jgi:cobalt-precorrin-5B (C1)-methyltransferase